jgi:hypothetical protein
MASLKARHNLLPTQWPWGIKKIVIQLSNRIAVAFFLETADKNL